MIYKGNSAIHGNGLFAGEPIKKGEVIGRWEVIRTFTESKFNIYIENLEYRVTNLLKYSNFSKDPNAESDGWLIIAKKNICQGEEITWDYGGEFEE